MARKTYGTCHLFSGRSVRCRSRQLAANGNVVSVWQETINDNYCIKASSKAKAASDWTTPVVLSDSTTNSFSPQLVVDGAGNAVAIWTSELVANDGLIRSLYASQCPSGGSWSSIATLSSPNQNVGNVLRLCIDASLDVSAEWIADFNLYSASASIGGSWSAPVQVSQ